MECIFSSKEDNPRLVGEAECRSYQLAFRLPFLMDINGKEVAGSKI